MPLPTLVALADMQEGFVALCVSAGREVLRAMMEQDRTILCAAKGVPNPQRTAGRRGSVASEVTFGGRWIGMRRLRVRSVKGMEVEVPSLCGTQPKVPRKTSAWHAGRSAGHIGSQHDGAAESVEDFAIEGTSSRHNGSIAPSGNLAGPRVPRRHGKEADVVA
jgi:hypothetical protein